MLITDMKGSGRGLIESHTRVLYSVAEKEQKNSERSDCLRGLRSKCSLFLKRIWDIKLSRTKLYPLISRDDIEG